MINKIEFIRNAPTPTRKNPYPSPGVGFFAGRGTGTPRDTQGLPLTITMAGTEILICIHTCGIHIHVPGRFYAPMSNSDKHYHQRQHHLWHCTTQIDPIPSLLQ